MGQLEQTDGDVPLVSTSGDLLRLIETVVKRRLVDQRMPEQVATGREYEDALNYLTIDLDVRSGEESRLRIEFGVRDGRFYRATGGMVADWQEGPGVVGAIDVVLLDGVPSDLSSFTRRFATYLNLPEVAANGVLNERNVHQVV